MNIEYNAVDVKKRIEAEFERRGEKAYKALPEKLGMSKSTLENKSMPKADTLARIADYLDVSVDSLLGRHTAVAAVAPASNAGQLLSVFNRLSAEDQQRLIIVANSFLDFDEKKKPNVSNAVLV